MMKSAFRMSAVALFVTAAVGFSSAASAAEQPRDEFFWLGEMNKATAVINSDEGLLDKDVAPKLAQGIQTVIDNGSKPGAKRPKIVIAFEPLLIEAAGMEATMLHIGRSSQDMHATFQSAIMRDNVIALTKKLSDVMSTMQQLARNNVDTIVPNYTNGVAAQPNSYAHYLQGHLSGFARDLEKLGDFYDRLNWCAMGTTVLNGTSWPLNRDRMAQYLAFEGPVPNAYDAGQIKSVDEAVEFASIQAGIALHVGTFLQDVMVQYAQPRPWILLAEGGGNTYVSSAMPQKRNPGIIINTRAAASKAIGDAQTTLILSHNIPPGMVDPKPVARNNGTFKLTMDMLGQFDKVLKALVVNPERALEELNLDWTASQEVADVLMREHGLPFRVGHHVASRIVSFAKANNIKPSDFPYAEVKRIYAEVIKEEYPKANPECPMTEERFRETLNPIAIVKNRRTSGGPQPAELNKAIERTDKVIAERREWADNEMSRINKALERLDADFKKLLAK